MLRVGIIGCGKIAQVRHVPEYRANAHCELVAFYDPVRERADALAAPHQGRVFDSVEALLGSGVDAVSVCAANAAHAEICIKAMEMGVHVLCEKPMAVTLEACERMAATARRTHTRLVIGHNQRLTETHRKARECIARGDIGNVLRFQTSFSHAGPERWTGRKDTWFFSKDIAALGALGDLGIHKVDLIHFLLGEPVVRVFAKLYTADKKDADGRLVGVDDNALCTMQTRSGILGQMQASWTNYGPEENATVIYGSKGVLRCYADPLHSLIIDFAHGDRKVYALDAIATNAGQLAGQWRSTGVVDAFVRSILRREASFCDAQDALLAMRAVFAAQRSAALGEEVEIRQ